MNQQDKGPIQTERAQKKALRSAIYELANGCADTSFDEWDKVLFDKVLSHPRVLRAQHVLSYWSMPREAGTQALNEELSLTKSVYLPVIEPQGLVVKRFTGHGNMVVGPKYGIKEPVGPVFNDLHLIDLVLVPGVAFSTEGLRLGHGKGYYDRLLPTLTHAYTLGLCYHFQVVGYVPTGPFDFTLHEIIAA
ncbi:MAG: 5-formyltetrahydrofolate cyclo-ligase [Bacteroidetes bacterium]|jgi:5-formyltetrahydrofolate cyclo-ligase|nr:5-formyltetrahydrofolate cyclo-ligase [Bacteroidota bacterium]